MFKLKNKPCTYKRISQYYKAGSHKGIDLANVTGTPVYATADGTVVAASYGAWDKSYGNMVALYHGDGTYTNHAHLSKINVKVGQKIKAGTCIGLVGSTGRSTGPHLHFEIHLGKKWNRINPLPYMNAVGKDFKEPEYVVGKTYTLQEDMNVRTGPSTSYKKKPVSQWTPAAQRQSTKAGLLKKGTKVTVLEVKNGWIRIPSGWVCGFSGTKVYVK